MIQLESIRTQGATWLVYACLAIAFLLLSIPLIAKPSLNVYDHRDEASFHYATVQSFTEQLPFVDVSDYRSATTPLYHLELSILARYGVGKIGLRFINMLLSVACLAVIYKTLSNRGDPLKAWLFVGLLMFSPYFLGPAVRISTDNVALLSALLVLYVMDVKPLNRKYFWVTCLLILVTVWTRQVYAWLLGAYFLHNLIRTPNQRWEQMIIPMAVPVVGLAYFVWLWHGFTPPSFQAKHSSGLNWDAPVFIVSLVGFYSSVFGLWIVRLSKGKGELIAASVLAILATIGFLLIHPVSNAYPLDDNSRGGWLWAIAAKLPEFAGSSIVFWGLFPVGLVSLYILGRHLIERGEYLMPISFPLFMAANLASGKTYQKYYEPFVLFCLGYALVTLIDDRGKVQWGAGIALLLAMSAVATLRFFG